MAVHVEDAAARFERGRKALMRKDVRLSVVIKAAGRRRPDFSPRDPFRALVRAVLSQQLSTKAADTIDARVNALVGGREHLSAEALLVLSPDALRAAGVSRPKIAYLRDLASRVAEGTMDLHGLQHQSDAEVVAAITAIKGFGVWSAEMFLMFCLHRSDVFPVGDLGIVKGVQALAGMKRRPQPRTMTRIAEAWRPHRSVASWYLWRLVE